MIINIIQFIIGAILLYYGAELLIYGSKSIAEKYKISPIIVGITLVAFGTSLPELIVSIIAVLKNDSGIVIGNVVGSNVTNIGLVLSMTAMISPIYYAYTKIKFDLSFLVFITVIPLIFLYIGSLVIWHGIFFILLLFIYCLVLYNKNKIIDDEELKQFHGNYIYIIIKIIIGIIGLGLGAHFFVIGAKEIAVLLGVSSVIIGMSIVALGTSLPELAASIAAARHNQTDFVIGNVIGSNIMNIIAVLGFTTIIRPISINFLELKSQVIFLLLLTIFLFLIIKFKGGISKFSGTFLFIIYLLFLYFNFDINLINEL